MNTERILEFEPAFDKRHPDPDKNYGIHGVTMRFVVKGPLGAVQFVLYTNWQLPHVRAEQERRGCGQYCLNKAMPADLGYHSPKPMYEGDTPMGATRVEWEDNDGSIPGFDVAKVPKSYPTGTFTPCEYLDGAPCYYDGSGLNAERIFDVLCAEGDDGVWRALEEYYAETFAVGRGVSTGEEGT